MIVTINPLVIVASVCAACGGQGRQTLPCPAHQGSNCPVCNGRGTVSVICPTCKGSGT